MWLWILHGSYYYSKENNGGERMNLVTGVPSVIFVLTAMVYFFAGILVGRWVFK